jgi:predicted permease
MGNLVRDIRFGLKLLLKEKTFSATVLATLAICIGANVAIFSVIHTVLLDPLPYENPESIVYVYNSYPGAGAARASSGSADYFYRRERVDAFQEVALFQGSGNTVGDAGETEQVSSLRVTPSFLPLLGVQPFLGRGFTEDEMDVGNHRKVVLTHSFWQEYFGASTDVLGQDLRLDGEPFEVVGVLPADFQLVGRRDTRFLIPIPFTEEQRTIEAWHNNNYLMLARLRPGATIEQADAQIAALNASMIEEWPLPNAAQLLKDVQFTVVVRPFQEDLVRDIQPTLFMLWAGVAFVLLIGCVNIANLMLARSQVRMTELATRLALGAQRGRVALQLLTEAIVMGVLGGILGTGVGVAGLKLLERMGVDDLPRGAEVGLDGTVLLFTLGIAVAAGVIFGAIPLFQLMRSDLSSVFRTEGRTGTASRRAVAVRNVLVTGQVALAFVMLIGAGLMFVSFRSALAVDPGFQAEGVFTGMVSLPESRYPEAEDQRQFTDRLMEQIRALPGVEGASVTSMLPFSGNNSSSVILPEGYAPEPGESLLSPFQSWVGDGYFETLGIGLVEGRTFEPSDGPDAANAIIIDRWLARRYWPDSSPLGKRMVWGAAPGSEDVSEENLFTVVGVVETIKQTDLTAPDAEHVGAYYFPVAQRPITFMTLAARASGDAAELTPAVRDVLRRLDPELPLFGTETLTARIDESLASRRVPLVLLTVFAGVALFLAVVGIYGALAYSITQRTREFGIRMAMGSGPEKIFRMVLGQGSRVIGAGLAVGALSAFFLVRLIQSLLFGVQATNPGVMAAVAAVLALAGLVACLLPARRATRVDPVVALSGS